MQIEFIHCASSPRTREGPSRDSSEVTLARSLFGAMWTRIALLEHMAQRNSWKMRSSSDYLRLVPVWEFHVVPISRADVLESSNKE